MSITNNECVSALTPPPLDLPQRTLLTAWLGLGVTAITLAGLYAILLVAARAPAVQAMTPSVDLFRTALVVHVELSVFVWFVAMAAVITRLAQVTDHLTDRLAWLLAAVGTGLVVLAPLFGGKPSLNNYFPMLQQPLFYVGLAGVGAGVGIQALLYLYRNGLRAPQTPFGTSVLIVNLALLLSAAIFLLDLQRLPMGSGGHAYFEQLFWGTGHTLQFAYSQLLFCVLLWLAAETGVNMRWRDHTYTTWLRLGILPLLAVLWVALTTAPASAEQYLGYTTLMRWGGLLPALPVGCMLIWCLLQDRRRARDHQRAARYALYGALLLFVVGGLLGFAISGSDTRVPAHYHGSIVGVTLGLMGATYLILPRLGFAAIGGRLARSQPLIYSGGQILHVAGLVLLGLQGGARKTVAIDVAKSGGEMLARGVMGFGGLLAIIGGILFVVLVIRSVAQRHRNH